MFSLTEVCLVCLVGVGLPVDGPSSLKRRPEVGGRGLEALMASWGDEAQGPIS